MKTSIASAVILVLLGIGRAQADERLFSFSYGAEVLPKGGMEYEQWLTDYNGHADGVFNRYQIDEELEYGITDKFSGSLYIHLNDNYSSIDTGGGNVVDDSEFRFDGVSTEWKYLLLSPFKDSFGLMLYFEPRYSGEELELEGKLILQKNIGEHWESVLNLVVEQEYGYSATETSIDGEPNVSLGLAYIIAPGFSIGLEAKEDMDWADNWGYEATNAWYLGPTIHAATEKWWATLGLVAQMSGRPESIPGDGRMLANDNEDYSKVQVKLGTGINF